MQGGKREGSQHCEKCEQRWKNKWSSKGWLKIFGSQNDFGLLKWKQNFAAISENRNS